MLPTLFVILTGVLLYWFPIRRWMGQWGATSCDLARVMAGDLVIANPTHSATHAVTVAAPPEDIWPWLVQMGYRRGGCTAMTGSIGSLAISIVRVRIASFPSFSSWRWAT